MQCLMDHIVLNVEDDEKMIAFYSQVLMFPTERLDEYRAGRAVSLRETECGHDYRPVSEEDAEHCSVWRRPGKLEPLLYNTEQGKLTELVERLGTNAVPDRRRSGSPLGRARYRHLHLFSGP